MTWVKEAITDGEIDALHRAALAACNDDTRYPSWRGSSYNGNGECYNIARWLVRRLGGHIGRQRGHYVWLSPDDRYYIDLLGGHTSAWQYEPNHGHFHRTASVDNERTARFIKRADRIFDSLDQLLRLSLDYAGDAYPAEEPQAADDSDRFNDSFTEPEQYWHDEPDPTTPQGEYQFIFANGQLEVSPNHSHADLASHVGIDPGTHTGPFAAGHVTVNQGRATWQVQANVNLHAFFRILKDATKNYGWTWGGMTDANGQPIIEAFAPKKSSTTLHYTFIDDHLYIGAVPPAILALSSEATSGRPVTGTLRVSGTAATVDPHSGGVAVLPALFEWAADNGLTLYAGNVNVIKTIPDLQQHDTYNPETLESPNPMEPPVQDERLPSGLYSCPGCHRLFPDWREYSKHRRGGCEVDTDHPDANGDGGLPEPDHGLYGDGAHYTEMRQEPGITTGKVVVLPARTWKEAARVDGFMRYAKAFDYANDDHLFYVAYRNGDPIGYAAVKPEGWIQMMHSSVENQGAATTLFHTLTRHFDELATNAAHEKTASLLKRFGWVQANGHTWKWAKGKAPTDLLEAPVPFIYDVDKDKIHVGHPGARTSDIPGRFTPGGIVEGHYEPGGKVVIRSLTSVPYTVRHLIELWYYTQPQLEVKSVHLQDDAGKDTRLANVGATIKTLVAMNPAAHLAAQAITHAGGEAYAVGGALRDVLLGKEPHDIDVMVAGLSAAATEAALDSLPGKLARERTPDGQGTALLGNNFGVFFYRYKGHEVQVALARAERSTGPGHKEFDVEVNPGIEPEADLYRRDFTANALAVNLRTSALLDPYRGAADIASGTLRTLSPQSFAEDPLRVVRGVVAYARHGLEPDETTRAQMQAHAGMISHLPGERIRAELDKLFESEHPGRAIRLAHETGVLTHILPEVEAAFGYDQANPHHELELGDHLANVLDRLCEVSTDPDLRLAALLHDIGKPGSAWKDPSTQSNHYYAKRLDDGTMIGADHEVLGAEMARERMKVLRYPTDRIERITRLIELHMYPHYTTERGARRFLAKAGQHAEDLIKLRWADQGGKTEYPSDPTKSLDTEKRLIARVRTARHATTQKQLTITGHDLIRDGHKPGPQMGRILAHLMDRVLDDPALNEPNTLLVLAKEYGIIHEDAQVHASQAQQAEVEVEEVRLQGVRPRESQKLAQGDEEAQVEPEFPTVEDAQAVHDQAVADHGQPYAALLDPGKLESAMGRAANHYYYGQGTHGELIADAAGALAHGMGMSQAFEDGNKKTAYHTTRGFLHANGYGHLSPLEVDDEELADHLTGHGEGTHSLDDTQQMFRNRLG